MTASFIPVILRGNAPVVFFEILLDQITNALGHRSFDDLSMNVHTASLLPTLQELLIDPCVQVFLTQLSDTRHNNFELGITPQH